MKTKRTRLRSRVIPAIASALSVAFLASAQVTNQLTKKVSSSHTDGNDIIGSVTYNYTMKVILTGPQYVTYASPGMITAEIDASTSTILKDGLFTTVPRGTIAEFFGSGGQIGLITVGLQPYTSSIKVTPPDYFNGTGANDVSANINTAFVGAWMFSFGIQEGPFSISATPPAMGCPISLQGSTHGGTNEIDIADSVNEPTTAINAKTEDGLFADGGSIVLGGSVVYESTNGMADIGVCSLNVTMNCAVVPPQLTPIANIGLLAASKTASVTVQYIRGDHLINDNHPTLTASASPSQIGPNQTTTITVQIYNPSPDLSTANGTLNFSGIGLNGAIPVPTQYQGITIPPHSSVTETFQILPVTAGSYNPVINFQTGWQAPVPAAVTMPQPISVNAPFTATGPDIPVAVQSIPSGLSFTVDGTTYTSAKTFNWGAGSSHTIGTRATQNGGPDIQYLWSSWSDFGAVSHTVSPTAATTYTANFTTQYFLTMDAGTGGSVSPASGWIAAGAPVQIKASADSNYGFSDWTGSGVGSYSGNFSSTFIQMNTPITEIADFTAIGSPSSFDLIPLAGNEFQNTLSGPSLGKQAVLQTSTDLKSLAPVQTNTDIESTLKSTNPSNPSVKGQYFRATVN